MWRANPFCCLSNEMIGYLDSGLMHGLTALCQSPLGRALQETTLVDSSATIPLRFRGLRTDPLKLR
jgi:hypothetical protein